MYDFPDLEVLPSPVQDLLEKYNVDIKIPKTSLAVVVGLEVLVAYYNAVIQSGNEALCIDRCGLNVHYGDFLTKWNEFVDAYSKDEETTEIVNEYRTMFRHPELLCGHIETPAPTKFDLAYNKYFEQLQQNLGDLLCASASDTSFAMRQAVNTALHDFANYVDEAEYVWLHADDEDEADMQMHEVWEDITSTVQDYKQYGGEIANFIMAWADLFLAPRRLFDYVVRCREEV